VHYWLALARERLVAALVYLFTQFQFECNLDVLGLVRGCEAGLAESTERLTTLTKDVFQEETSGVAEITKVLPQEATKEISCITEWNLEGLGNRFEQTSLRGAAENEKFEQAGKSVEVLLMN
jgi:hypothetical protein